MLKSQFLSGSSTHLLHNPNTFISCSTAPRHGSSNLVRMATPAASRTREGSGNAHAKFPLFGDRAAKSTHNDVKARSSSKGGEWFSATRAGLSTISNKVGSYADSILHHPAKNNPEYVQYQGTMTIQKKLLMLDLVDPSADELDDASDKLLGHHVSVQLVSNEIDPKTGKAFVSDEVAVENWVSSQDLLTPTDFKHKLDYYVPKNFGIPGAIIVQNKHPNEFLLVSFSLDMPDSTVAHYSTNSWVYNTKINNGRIFFRNQAYLPSETPAGLKELREQEMRNLRGDGQGERQVKDRIYDYDVYNDLGNPDKDHDLSRPTLGGNQTTPYPRRCRTGRARTNTEPLCESPLKDPRADIYIPRDEKFDRVKNSDFKADTDRSQWAAAMTAIRKKFLRKQEFDNMASIMKLFAPKSIDLDLNHVVPHAPDIPKPDQQPLIYLEELLRPDGTPNSAFHYPLPKYLQGDPEAWKLDDEFAREFLAGLNPVVIKLLTEFPIKSKLDPQVCGDPVSGITAEHIEDKLEGLKVKQALAEKKLFVADYHDTFYPYVNLVNAQKDTAMYATRALFFKRRDGTLRVVALELVLPPQAKGGKKNSRVFTPSKTMEWTLAKAHVSANDIFIHQVISHFTRCHAVTEPFIIATNRHLSAMHPMHQLLAPHFKSTMETNIAARKALINANGIIETVFTPHRYSMEIAAVDYKQHWQFDLQALPNELIKRGMAVEDSTSNLGVKLVIEDYPYAADGLELWGTIKSWIKDYVDIYYKDDATVCGDIELKNWWDEVRNKGHGDKKDAAGWPVLNSKQSLVQIVTIIKWVVSCQHSAVNFGQYHVGAFMPHHPTTTRRLIPEEGTKDWEELKANPERFHLSLLSNTTVTTTVMSVYEVLSTHSADEEYLGQRNNPYWTDNAKVKTAFKKFSDGIAKVNQQIKARNQDKKLKNRYGNVDVAYELLCPVSTQGMTATGVPNSVTI